MIGGVGAEVRTIGLARMSASMFQAARGGAVARLRRGRGFRWVALGWIGVLLAATAVAQEVPSEPERPKTQPLGVGLTADLPGGLDMTQPDKVQERLAAANKELEALAENDPRRADKQKLLKTKIEILEGQLALLEASSRLQLLQAELTPERKAAAEKSRDEARKSLDALDPDAELEDLRAVQDVEVLRPRVEAEFVERLRVEREASTRLANRIKQQQEELAAGETSRTSARSSLATHQVRLEELRKELQTRTDLTEDDRKLLERRVGMREQGVTHEKGRLQYLDLHKEVLERSLAVLTIEQEAQTAVESRYRRLEAAAKTLLDQRLEERKRTLAYQVSSKQKEIEEAETEHERLRLTAELESLKLDAELQTLRQASSEVQGNAVEAEELLGIAREELESLQSTYRGSEPRPELREVEEKLRRLRRQTDRADYARTMDACRDRHEDFSAQLEEAERRLARLREDFEAQRAKAKKSFEAVQVAAGKTPFEAELAWTQSEALRWSEQSIAQERDLGETVQTLRSIVSFLDRTLDARTELQETRRETLVLLQRENLFLRRESRITWPALTQGFRDLLELPQMSFTAIADLTDYGTNPDHFSGLMTFAIAALLATFLLGLITRGLRKRSRRMLERELTTMPARFAVLALRLLRAAGTAFSIWLVVALARWLLPGLGLGMQDWLADVGDILLIFWFGRALARELLRPNPPSRAVIRFAPKSAARLYTAVAFVLWFSVIFLPIQLALVHFGYQHENEGAFELLDLIYRCVTGLTLLVIVASRQTFAGLVPGSSQSWLRLVGWALRALRPFLLLLIPALLLIEGLRYEFLAGFIWTISGFVLLATLGGYLAYLGGSTALEAWLRSAAAADEGDEVVRRREVIRITSLFALKLIVIFGVGGMFLAAVGFPLDELRLLLSIPLPFQASDSESRVTWWHLIVAGVALAVFLPAARHAKSATGEFLAARTNLDAGLRYTITTMVGYILLGLGIYLSATQLVNLENLGYVVAALSVGIGFGLQEIISNFVSGIILLFERPLRVGDIIEVGGREGIVKRIDIRATTLLTRDNLWILVPNKDLVTKEVINFVYTDSKLRIRITVGVAYGSDTALVRRALLEVAHKDGRVLERPAPDVYFLDFGESSLDFVLLVWVSDSLPKERISSDLRFAVDAAFRRHGITIPFPQRDLHLNTANARLHIVSEQIPDHEEAQEAEPEPEPPPRRIP